MPPNEDIDKERLSSTFKPDDVTQQIFGKEGMHVRRLAFKRVASDPQFEIAERFPMMPRDEVYNEAIRLYAVYRQRIQEYQYSDPWDKISGAQNFFKEAVFIGPVYPFGVHHDLFIPMIESQGTDEQIAEFVPRAHRLEIIGTYGQTEIRHGTYLKGLETTATFDRERQHFIIHSPTLTATKFWPAGLGCTSNYAVVMAQLIIDGKRHGLHSFLCQLRDLENHKPLSGVEIGDINHKFGFGIMDNGYVRFNQCRVPRTNMLMRYAQVSWDGVFTRQRAPQVAYLTMMTTRMMMVLGAADDLAMAATIATRYSAVRRQTANSKGIEPQVLDYQTQQMKLLPAISTAYAFFFTGIVVKSIYREIFTAVQAGDLSRLKEVHCITSGMKAFASETAVGCIETCRRACGGHGYSHASGLPNLYVRCLAQSTYEGENTVMYLQCARSLLTFLLMKQAGQPIPGTLGLLEDSPDVTHELRATDSFNFDLYKVAFKVHTLRMIYNVANKLQLSSQTTEEENAWNMHSVDLVNTARGYSRYLTVSLFIKMLESRDWEPKAKAVMSQVCEFYIVNSILENSGSFLQSAVLMPQQISSLTTRRNDLLAELRPNAVSLVDAFDYPDRMLNSCLGRYDGNGYEALYEYAKSSSLNKDQVHTSHHKYVKPMQKALRSRL